MTMATRTVFRSVTGRTRPFVLVPLCRVSSAMQPITFSIYRKCIMQAILRDKWDWLSSRYRNGTVRIYVFNSCWVKWVGICFSWCGSLSFTSQSFYETETFCYQNRAGTWEYCTLLSGRYVKQNVIWIWIYSIKLHPDTATRPSPKLI